MNKLIDIEMFKKIIKNIIHVEETNEQLTNILVCKDCTGWVSYPDELITNIVRVLEKCFNDEYETISWWLWDCGFTDKENKYIYEDKKRYNLNDIEDLYYYLCGELDKVTFDIVEEEDNPPVYQEHCTIDDIKEMWEKMV